MRGSVKYLIAALRFLAAAAGLIAVIATFIDATSRAAVNPFNFFGFFTIQSNIIFIVVLFVAAISGFIQRSRGAVFMLIRACATTYIVIVGLVYNTLLVGLEGGVTLAWANWVLHVAIPIYAALDWIIFSDRDALPWKRIWISLLYPLVWLAVVLIRGATDGWVPYPFLSPTLGYGVVAAYCAAIAAATIVVAAAVWVVSRVRLGDRGRRSVGTVAM
jgi:hypothetical protein